jgi:hypothetical protein
MKHNENKINLLNEEAKKYYYFIKNRDYIHSSTLMTWIYETLRPMEISLSLKKPVSSGFTVTDIPSNDDYGFVVINNTVLYLTHMENEIHIKNETELSGSQQKLYTMISLVQSKLDLLTDNKNRYLSKKATIYTPKLFSSENHSINIKSLTHENSIMVDISFDFVNVCRIYAVPNPYI